MRNFFYFISHDTTRPKNFTRDTGSVMEATTQLQVLKRGRKLLEATSAPKSQQLEVAGEKKEGEI